MNKKVEFLGEKCRVDTGVYANGRLAIRLTIEETGEPMATATVNVPDCTLDEDEVLIKDWSENEGMVDALVKAGIVVDTGVTWPCGFTHANVCRVVDMDALLKEDA